jgi:ABC-2 type transport system permease protein
MSTVPLQTDGTARSKMSFRKYLKTQRTAKFITIAIFLAILFAVGFGIYSFFRWEFGLIAQDPYLRVALPLYFYEGLLLIVFGLVFVSSFITGMFALFRGRDDALVMASPRYATIFRRAYWRTFLQSLWPILVIVLPAFLGSTAVFPVSFWGGVLFFLAVAFLTGIAVALAIALFVTISCVLYLLQRFMYKFFGLGGFFGLGKSAFVGVIVIAFGIWFGAVRAWSGDIVSIFAPFAGSTAAGQSAYYGSSLNDIISRFSIFPSHLATLALFDAQAGAFGSSALAALGLGLSFLMCLAILWVASRSFLPLWQLFQEGSFEAKKVAAPARLGAAGSVAPASFPRFWKSPLGALFEKEGIMLFRDGRSALWFFFLLALWAVQVVMGFFIRANLIKYSVNLSMIVAQVEALELATTIYFVSAFIVRFVFPAFSSERRTAWILGTAPIDLKKVFWAKLLFYVTIFLALGIAFCAVNLTIIQTALVQTLSFGIFALLMIVFLVAFGLSLGAIFPNFESDDPEALSTSLPGLGFTFGSLAYGGAGAYFFYKFLSGGPALPVVCFDALTVALTTLFIFLALRSLEKIEFVKAYAQ